MDAGMDTGWVIWAIAIAVGIPLVLVVLTEVLAALTRRGNPAAGPVRFLRNWVVPVAAVLVFLLFAVQQPTEQVGVRLVATLFGFLLILLVLAAFNVALFQNARAGTWRDRIPNIFVSIVRVLLILVGLALIFSWVWGADVGGFFTALGVTSIVIGLALQNAVGSVISGLLLLFEQPFKIGDWLDTGDVRGRVIDVNWRAVHIETPSGTRIVPNASLAGGSFTNLSRPANGYHVSVDATFGTDDAPFDVMAMLAEVAGSLPMLAPGGRPVARYNGQSAYTVDLPLRSPAVAAEAKGMLLAWLWYAARRRGLALDGDATDPVADPARLRAAVEQVAPLLHLDGPAIEAVLADSHLEQYGVGETVQRVGVVPRHLRVVIEGRMQLWAMAGDQRIDIAAADAGEYVGHTSLTREAAFVGATALAVTTVLVIPRATLDALVRTHPEIARSIGRVVEKKRRLVEQAVATAGVASGSLLR
ncbi:mechanosensitive ion channel domain-containing protein [Agromyces larvae]|uniref:Mechanosensitive ion channel n=1 Tax=Agromyces larvae TaxID=2929802 RepID=A0ABY4BXV0_9MICO|nr:mechanosensitive ion channel domain-containing protein [Agromyces larvae]UOE43998.1 mechanosensitive ion channel [Agromyces larvae]